jgi:hypothetical protein
MQLHRCVDDVTADTDDADDSFTSLSGNEQAAMQPSRWQTGIPPLKIVARLGVFLEASWLL